ncbi:transposase-like protein DUF772 [Paraburkholderia sp. BL18I3N2]|nr:transposase-like protein DUF772 [Paraburkholderia sp. BL18I3N2]PRX92651.1 transposase-like protein DUF772 [Paraburkholderia sp. BL25I1N1]
MEQMRYNLLFRWFVGLAIEDDAWDHSVFSKNRDRLLEHEVVEALFTEVMGLSDKRGLLSREHFSVVGTLIQTWGIANAQAVDIIFAGKQTIDGDTAQVGPAIAMRLGVQLLTYVSRIVETDLDARTIVVERRAEGGVQVLKTALPCLVTMLENTNELRFATLPAMIHAAGFPVRKWNREQAGIEDVSKVGLKGSPTVVSKVFAPTPRDEKAEMLELDASSLRDVSLKLVHKIFARHPTLEADLLMKRAS